VGGLSRPPPLGGAWEQMTGGFRISAANTVAIQFCNVSRNNSAPTSGVYTFTLMR